MTKKHFYPEVESGAEFPSIEKDVLKYWQENKIFEKSVQQRPAKKDGKNNCRLF